MGTSSGGGGGGGGSGVGGGGAGGVGEYLSSEGQMTNREYKPTDVRNEVGSLLTKLFRHASAYLEEMFCNPYLKAVFPELFTLSSLLHNENPVEIVGKRYDLDMYEPNFIFDLVSRFDQKFGREEVDSRCAEAIRQAVQEFLFRAVQDDPNVIISTGNDVVKAMADRVVFWQSLSGHFLSCLANAVYQKEIERKSEAAIFAIQDEIERRTNRVIESYEAISGRNTEDYRHLFQYVCENWEWFKKEMTE
jgi:hypothetical protein